MQVVFGPQDRTHPDDEEVPETGDESHDPDRYTQDNVSQQIFKRREPVRVGFTLAHVWGVRAVLELLEISADMIVKMKMNM